MAILTAPFLPAKVPAASTPASSSATKGATPNATRPVVDVPLHVHTGVWPLNMGAMPMTQPQKEQQEVKKQQLSDGDEPERLIEIDEIPFMTKGERRLAREVELQHARLR